MGKHAVGVFEGFVGDAAPVRGRTVVGLGIALGLAVGLGTWMLSDSPTRRQPLSMAQPANLPPPDVMVPSLVPPSVSGSDGVGVAPSSPADEHKYDSPPEEPVSKPSTPPAKSLPPEVAVIALTARYVTRQTWDVGYVADVHVTNKATVAQSFEVKLTLPRGVQLTNQIWNAVANRSSGTVTFRGSVPASQELIFGFVADKSRYATYPQFFEPSGCTVNGKPCDNFSPDQAAEDPYGYSPWSRVGMYGYG